MVRICTCFCWKFIDRLTATFRCVAAQLDADLRALHVRRAAKLKEMDDVVWANKATDLNLTSILEPIFWQVTPRRRPAVVH